jgi:hypothetical protein
MLSFSEADKSRNGRFTDSHKLKSQSNNYLNADIDLHHSSNIYRLWQSEWMHSSRRIRIKIGRRGFADFISRLCQLPPARLQNLGFIVRCIVSSSHSHSPQLPELSHSFREDVLLHQERNKEESTDFISWVSLYESLSILDPKKARLRVSFAIDHIDRSKIRIALL